MPHYAFDPELAEAAVTYPPPDLDDIGAIRARVAERVRVQSAQPLPPGVQVEDALVPGRSGEVPIRIYRPESSPTSSGALVFCHGGGFVAGSERSDHPLLLEIAARAGIVVVSVGYRLAPEYPFPSGLDDADAVLEWLHENSHQLSVDPQRIAVGGRSAGAAIAAALTLRSRARGGPPLAMQYLGDPMLDHRLSTPSMQRFTDTPVWRRQDAEKSWRLYLGSVAPVPAEASPAIIEELTGLPRAYITASEFDPLRDEALVYARRLLDAGVSVELHLFPGTFHGSLAIDSTISRAARDELIAALGRGLAEELRACTANRGPEPRRSR